MSVLVNIVCETVQWLSSHIRASAKRSIVKSGHDERARFGDKVDLRGSRTVNWITKCRGESSNISLEYKERKFSTPKT